MWSLQYSWWNLPRKKQFIDTFKLSYIWPLPPPIKIGDIIICYLGISRSTYQIYIFLNHLVVWNTWDLLTSVTSRQNIVKMEVSKNKYVYKVCSAALYQLS